MNEKEKKAIEIAKEYIENEEILSVSPFDVKRLLNLIDKQQKEIEDLRIITDEIEEHNITCGDTPEPEERFISKDKIREILNNTEKNIEEDRPSIVLESLILNIKELIGE